MVGHQLPFAPRTIRLRAVWGNGQFQPAFDYELHGTPGGDVLEQGFCQFQAGVARRFPRGLGVLAGGIAHDFNNLLVGILGNASLARAGLPPGSPERPILEDIEVAALRLSDLTRQMLAYAGKGRCDALAAQRFVGESLPVRAGSSFSATTHPSPTSFRTSRPESRPWARPPARAL